MSWRVLTRTGKDTWISSSLIHDHKEALNLFFSLKNDIEDDVMLVKEEHFSKKTEEAEGR